MADNNTVNYRIVAQDEVSGAAESAAGALKKLDQQISADTKALAGMQKAMRNLQAGSVVNVDTYRRLSSQMEATKQRIADAQSKVIGLGGSMTSSTTKTKEAKSKLQAFTEASQHLPGPLGGIVGKLGQLRSLLAGGGIAVGVVAIAAGIAALTVAAIAGTRALYEYGVAQADARRSELLRLEGLTKMRFLFQRVPGNAKEMQAAIDQVAAKTPLAREQVAKYSEQLYRMGLRGDSLTKTLEGVAIKSAVQGDAAANAFAGWAAGAALSGKSVDKLVDNVKGRLGGIAAKQMQSLTVQTLKQKEAFDSLFGALDIDAWLAAWKEVRDLLTQATASGRALKLMVTTLLQPLIKSSTETAPMMKRFFQGMIIGALQITIALLTVRNWFKKTFGDKSSFGPTEDFVVFLGKFLVGGAIATLVVGLTAFAAAIAAIVGPVMSVFYAVYKLWTMFGQLQDLLEAGRWVDAGLLLFDTLFDVLMHTVPGWFASLGVEIINGIIRGLGGGELIDTAKKMGRDMLVGFSSILGIESPSKAFMRVGAEIPAGVAAGVDGGAGEAEQATEQMVDAAAPKLGAQGRGGGALEGAPAAGAARSGTTINIDNITVQATSSKPEQLALDFRRELERVLEGFAFELGAPESA